MIHHILTFKIAWNSHYTTVYLWKENFIVSRDDIIENHISLYIFPYNTIQWHIIVMKLSYRYQAFYFVSFTIVIKGEKAKISPIFYIIFVSSTPPIQLRTCLCNFLGFWHFKDTIQYFINVGVEKGMYLPTDKNVKCS